MKHKIYSNGKEIPAEQRFDLLQDETIGVFETMRTYHGKVFLLEDHLARLLDSARTVGYKPLPDLKQAFKEVNAALHSSGEKNTSVRLTLYGGETFVIVGSREISKEIYQKGVTLKTASFPRGNPNAFPYQAKASAYQQAVLASTEPNPAKAFDWIFLDQANYLTETRTANFFIIKDGMLITPSEHLILNGVTRRFVIKCAHELGLEVRETPLTRHEFFNADEAFLSNTSWEILPVRELDGRVIGTKIPAGGSEARPAQPWRPGPITVKLHRFLKRRIQESCQSK